MEQNAPHNHSKLCPCPLPPSTPKPHTTTLDITQAYFIQITPCPIPPPGLKSKNKKYMPLLKFNFRWGLFYTKFSKKIIPLQPSNSGPPFCLPLQILSKMVWHVPVASKTTEEIDFWQKAWVQARAYLVGTGQGPTQKLLGTDQTTPESFIPIYQTVKKLRNIFWNIESH